MVCPWNQCPCEEWKEARLYRGGCDAGLWRQRELRWFANCALGGSDMEDLCLCSPAQVSRRVWAAPAKGVLGPGSSLQLRVP